MKFVEPKTSADEADFLLKKLKFHSEKVEEIDTKLSKICRDGIKPFIADGHYEMARRCVKGFYEGYSDFSIERDVIISELNRLINEKKPDPPNN